MRLIQFHVLLIYLISTPQKLSFDASWPAGDALYYVMINPLWSRFPWPWFFYSAFVSKTITYGSLLLEGTFPFLVWVKPLRRYLVLAMILFHCSMAITLRHIAFFSIAFGCGLWTFFSADDLYYFRDAARSACAHLRTAKSARAHA